MKKSHVNAVAIILIIALFQTLFIFVYVYPEFYLNGDNEFYNRVYSIISELNVFEAYIAFSVEGGSGTEPLSFMIMFASSKWFSYSTYFYFSNLVFLLAFGAMLNRLFDQWVVAYFLLCFSFYVLIASGLTQRLSLGIIFWMFSEFVTNKRYKRCLELSSVISHWQMFIVFVSKECSFILSKLVHLKVKYFHVILMFIFSFVVFLMFDQWYSKIAHKLTGVHFDAFLILVWPVLLRTIGLKVKLEHVIFFMFVFIIALIISSGRLNIVCFFYSIFLLRGKSKYLLYFSLILTPYFIYKNFEYYSFNYIPGRVFGL